MSEYKSTTNMRRKTQEQELYEYELSQLYENRIVKNKFFNDDMTKMKNHLGFMRLRISEDGYLWAYDPHMSEPLTIREVSKIIEHLGTSIDVIENENYSEVDDRIKYLKSEISELENKRYTQELVDFPKDNIGYVYLLIGENGRYKIGTSKNYKQRLKQLRIASSEDHKLIHTIKSNNMFKLEKELHDKFDDKRVHSEWFDLLDSDVNVIKEM